MVYTYRIKKNFAIEEVLNFCMQVIDSEERMVVECFDGCGNTIDVETINDDEINKICKDNGWFVIRKDKEETMRYCPDCFDEQEFYDTVRAY